MAFTLVHQLDAVLGQCTGRHLLWLSETAGRSVARADRNGPLPEVKETSGHALINRLLWSLRDPAADIAHPNELRCNKRHCTACNGARDLIPCLRIFGLQRGIDTKRRWFIALVGGMVAGTLALLAMVMSAECATLEAVAGDEGLARCLSWLKGTWPWGT